MNDRNVAGESGVHATDLSFDLLSDPYRRALVQTLLRVQTDVIAFDALVDRVMTRLPSSVTADAARHTIELELRHVHVPMVADADLLTYEPGDEHVRIDRAALIDCLECVATTVSKLQRPTVNCS